MSGFLNIQQLILPFSAIEEVYTHLRKAGKNQVEGVALWAGTTNDTTFKIKTTIIPKQKAFNHGGGLLYMVEGEELHRINVWLYKNKMTLIAQIHSHPNHAYHSDTDDRYPIITTVGGISIVIPDFGFRPIAIEDWAVYRLNPSKQWMEQSSKEINSLISIVQDGSR